MSIFDNLKNALNSFPVKSTYKINRMRPPGSVDDDLFMKLCIRCARCVEACPYRVLRRSSATKNAEIGTPYIYADVAGCQLCMKCTSVCPTGAIDSSTVEMQQVSIGVARINEDTCMNHLYAKVESGELEPTGNMALCNSCLNTCPLKDDAIYLRDGIIPTITEKCTGCGLCVERCPIKPIKAIYIIPKNMPDAETAGYYNYLKRIGKK